MSVARRYSPRAIRFDSKVSYFVKKGRGAYVCVCVWSFPQQIDINHYSD